MNSLAVSAAQALVQSMTTSTWNEIRSSISATLNRHRAGKRLISELNATHTRLMANRSNRDSEMIRWALMLDALAESSPGAATDVQFIHQYLNQAVAGRGRPQITQIPTTLVMAPSSRWRSSVTKQP